MKLSLKKLNALGASHVVALMLVVVGAGIVGTWALLNTHADNTQVACSSIGSGKYNCTWTLRTPVVNGSNRLVGTFYQSSTNWITCQQKSSVNYYRGSYYNHWWAWTISDQNTGGWVNATYGHGGVNDGTFGGGVPNCNGSHGSVPTIKKYYGYATNCVSAGGEVAFSICFFPPSNGPQTNCTGAQYKTTTSVGQVPNCNITSTAVWPLSAYDKCSNFSSGFKYTIVNGRCEWADGDQGTKIDNSYACNLSLMAPYSYTDCYIQP